VKCRIKKRGADFGPIPLTSFENPRIIILKVFFKTTFNKPLELSAGSFIAGAVYFLFSAVSMAFVAGCVDSDRSTVVSRVSLCV
jgi:hypothetical protein